LFQSLSICELITGTFTNYPNTKLSLNGAKITKKQETSKRASHVVLKRSNHVVLCHVKSNESNNSSMRQIC